MAKTDVYSWRISPDMRAALEVAARRKGVTLARLLDRIAQDWLRDRAGATGPEDDEQARLHAAARATLGTIAGGDPRRAERARSAVRRRLHRRRER